MRVGGVPGNQAFLPVIFFFFFFLQLQSLPSFTCFHLFFFFLNGANCAALGPLCVKSLTAVHS